MPAAAFLTGYELKAFSLADGQAVFAAFAIFSQEFRVLSDSFLVAPELLGFTQKLA